MDSDFNRLGYPIEDVFCPSCSSSINQEYTFCPKCGGPMGPLTTLDPVQTIRAEGFVLQKATETRPKPIVLVGIWILFFPGFLIGLWFSITVAINRAGSGASDFVFFWIGVLIAYIAAVFLFKVTRNYLRHVPSETTKSGDN